MIITTSGTGGSSSPGVIPSNYALKASQSITTGGYELVATTTINLVGDAPVWACVSGFLQGASTSAIADIIIEIATETSPVLTVDFTDKVQLTAATQFRTAANVTAGTITINAYVKATAFVDVTISNFQLFAVGLSAVGGTGPAGPAGANGTNGTNGTGVTYTSIVGYVNQTSTNAPVFTIFYNNTGRTLTPAYTSEGVYTITPSTPFDKDKTYIPTIRLAGQSTGVFQEVISYIDVFGNWVIKTGDLGGGPTLNDVLLDANFEIRIYP